MRSHKPRTAFYRTYIDLENTLTPQLMKAITLYLSLALTTLCLLVSNAVHAGDIIIDDASVLDKNGSSVVSSKMEFLFSEAAIEALESGVALQIEFNLKIKRTRTRRYLWDKRISTLSKRLKIERHALTERYIVTDSLDQQRRIFESINSAFDGLNEMSDIPVSSLSELQDGEYTIALRARLDIEALPAPMRPIAYISPAWRMSSEWFEWNSPQ